MSSAKRASWIVAFVLVVQTALLAWGAWRHSPTIDEVTYLPAGIWHWSTGQFRLARVSPPLARLVAAVPLVTIESPTTEWKSLDTSQGRRADRDAGRDFVRVNGSRSFWYFTLARWACIPFSVLGTWICYRWASVLYGPISGVVAAIMWCFSPNLLAHGQLVTADMAVTSFGIAASYAFWRWLRQPIWSRALAMGILLGLCQLSKTSGLILVAVWPLMWLIDRWPFHRSTSDNRRGHELAQLLLANVLALWVLNGGYLFQGTGTPLGQFEFTSAAGTGVTPRSTHDQGVRNRFAESWIGIIPMPLPKDYVLGMDAQRGSLEGKQRSYLRGTFKRGGWWYYYLYGLAVKVPLGTWLVLAVALGAALFLKNCSAPWRDEMCLLVPLVAIMVVVSSHTGFSHHVRYVLPIAPFAIIWASKVGRACQLGNKVLTGLVSVGLAWAIASSMYVYPHSLSYFNEVGGGPRNGHDHLINSNIDWAQDLLYLRDWLEDHPEARPLGLAFYGEYSPSVAGIEFALPPAHGDGDDDLGIFRERRPGWYAVSVNYLHGHRFPVFDEDGVRHKVKRPYFAYFANLTPVATAGYSIYIYHLAADDFTRVSDFAPR